MIGKKEIVYHYQPGFYKFPIPFLLNNFIIGVCQVEMTVNDVFDTTIIVIQDDLSKGSITNNFEQIATSIQKLFFKRIGILPEHVKWIELYPSGVVGRKESRCAVVMQWDAKEGIYHSPDWGPHIEVENQGTDEKKADCKK